MSANIQPLGNGSSYANLLYNGLVFDGSYGYGVGDEYIQFNSGFNPGIGGQGPLARITANRLPEGYDTGRGKLTFAIRNGTSLTDVLTLDGYTATVAGNLCATGTKNAIVPTSQGMTKLYCDESTSPLFSTRGWGRLTDGRTHVELDPLYLETVTIDADYPMMVEATFYGPHGNWYVEASQTGFDLIDPSDSNARFHWVVQAARRGYESVYLEPTDVAQAVQVEGSRNK